MKMALSNLRNAILVATLALVMTQITVFDLFRSTSSSNHLYHILGLSPNASAHTIDVAYNNLYYPLLSRMQEEPTLSTKEKLLDVQHAHNTLSDERRRRNYDIFHLDELQAHVQRLKKRMIAEGDLAFPTDWQIEPWTLDSPIESLSINNENFGELVLNSDEVWVLQLYSEMSLEHPHHGLVSTWDRVARQLEGVARVGRVEIGQLQVSIPLAEKRPLFSKHPRFLSGLPEVVVLPSHCRQVECVRRYRGVPTAEALVDWVATSVLKLPQILYSTSKSVMNDVFMQGARPHKVKVLVFSGDGERALPFIRQAAKENWKHAQFAMVLWEERRAAFWESRFGITSAPAVVFVKDPGLQPFVHQGVLNSSYMETMMERHKSFVLPQLRSISANALGCDARGHSMAGNGTSVWYCVIVAGRTGGQLNRMHEVMRGVLENLKSTEIPSEELPQRMLATKAMRSRRLSLAWLDGATQKDFCYFYLHSPNMFETCGPSRNGKVEDVPKIFLIRYHKKVVTSDMLEKLAREKVLRAQNMWASLLGSNNENVASQLVALYNGSTQIGDIVEWISQMIHEGDNNELPSFGGKVPELIPEEKIPFWVEAKEKFVNQPTRLILNNEHFSWAFF